MKRLLKIVLWSVAVIVLIIVLLGAGFMYKIKNGFPVSYETDIPDIEFPGDQKSVLFFSKSTGYRHEASIETGKKVFQELAKKNDWFLYSTEEGGVFNPEQLARFDVVVFNNVTGRVLNDDQRQYLENYVAKGGKWLGIHGAGDNSHHWSWYETHLVGAAFSHHPVEHQLQEAKVNLNATSDSFLTAGLPEKWDHTEEWYIFFSDPREKDFSVLYSIDGNQIDPNGNVLWIKNKNFGMGDDHPVAWYRFVDKGKTFYTSMGHDERAWNQPAFVKMLENAVNW